MNSATVSTSTDVYTAPATGLSSNSAASTPASVITAAPPQTAIQPVIVSPFSVGRPGRVYRLQLWTWISKFSVMFSPPFFPPSKTSVKRLKKTRCQLLWFKIM